MTKSIISFAVFFLLSLSSLVFGFVCFIQTVIAHHRIETEEKRKLSKLQKFRYYVACMLLCMCVFWFLVMFPEDSKYFFSSFRKINPNFFGFACYFFLPWTISLLYWEGLVRIATRIWTAISKNAILVNIWRIICGFVIERAKLIITFCLAFLIGLFFLLPFFNNSILQEGTSGDPADLLLPFIRWIGLGWRPTNSIIFNVIIGIPHAVLVVIYVVPVMLLFLIFCLGTLLFLITGLFLSLIIHGLVTAVIFILRDIFKAGIGYISFDPTSVTIGVGITLVGGWALFIGAVLYCLVLPSLQKFVLNPLLTGFAIISTRFNEGIRGKYEQDEEPIIAKEAYKMEIAIPKKFDEAQITTDLQKYRSNESVLKSYLALLAERFYTGAETKLIERKLEQLNISKAYWDTAYEARVAQYKLQRVDEEQRLERQKLEKQRRELEKELGRIDLEDEAKRKELEAKMAKYEAEITEYQAKEAEFKKDVKEETDEEKEERLKEEAMRKAAHALAIEIATTEGAFKKAASRAEQEKKIKEEYPPEVADRIIDLVDKILAEEEI